MKPAATRTVKPLGRMMLRRSGTWRLSAIESTSMSPAGRRIIRSTPRRSPPQGSALRGRPTLPVLVFPGGDVSLDLLLRLGRRFQRFEILLRTIPARRPTLPRAAAPPAARPLAAAAGVVLCRSPPASPSAPQSTDRPPPPPLARCSPAETTSPPFMMRDSGSLKLY